MRVHFVCRDGARWQRILAEQSQSLVQVKPTQGAGNDPNLGQAYGHQIVALNPIDQGRGEKPPVAAFTIRNWNSSRGRPCGATKPA